LIENSDGEFKFKKGELNFENYEKEGDLAYVSYLLD